MDANRSTFPDDAALDIGPSLTARPADVQMPINDRPPADSVPEPKDDGPAQGRRAVGLRWALKRSFLEYIARAPGGRGSLGDGATATDLNEIVFQPDLVEPPESVQGGTFRAFRGTATFSGHFGMLLVRIASPWITIHEMRGELTVLDPFQRQEGARLRLATFDIDNHTIVDGFERWTAAEVRLAPEARELFNDVYPAGEALEPLTITVPVASSRVDSAVE
jgi:hypothetical protein